jgi:hypothetical protein
VGIRYHIQHIRVSNGGVSHNESLEEINLLFGKDTPSTFIIVNHAKYDRLILAISDFLSYFLDRQVD